MTHPFSLRTKYVKKLQEENEELAQENQQNELKIIMASFGKGQQEREESRLKEEEEQKKKRLAAKKAAIEKGALLDDDDDDVLLNYYADPDLSKWKLRLKVWTHRLTKAYVNFQPLAGDVFHINSQFGEGISVYFRFFKWLVLQTTVIGIIIALLWLAHVTSAVFDSTRATQFLGFLPLWMQYSSLSTSTNKVTYLVGFIVVVVFSVIVTARKYIAEFQLGDHDSDLVDQSTSDKTAKYVFSAWDWSASGLRRIQDQQKLIADQFRLLLAEFENEEARMNRTRSERTIYVLKKVAGNLAMTILILAAWAIIILLNLSQQEIIRQARQGAVGEVGIQFSAFLVPFSLTVINIIVPPIISKVTSLEDWDQQSFAILMEISRLFAMKILNLLIIMFGYFQMLQDQVYIAGTAQPSPVDGCKFDKIGLDFFSLFVSDFVVKKLANIGSVYGMRLFYSVRGEDYQYSPEYSVASSVIDAIYSQALLMIAFPFFPLVMTAASVLHYLNFKWEKFMLITFYQRPSVPWRAKDTGSYFMNFYVVTFAVMLLMDYWILNVVRIDCGLFNGQIMIEEMDRLMSQNYIANLFYRATTAPAIIWVLCCMITVAYALRTHETGFLRSHYDAQVKGLRTDILRLNVLIKRQAKRLEESTALLKAMEEEHDL